MHNERRRVPAGGRHRVYDGFVLLEEWKDGELIWSLQDATKDVTGNQIRSATVGETVGAIRRALRQSQAGFAQLLKVPVTTVRGWEQNRRQPGRASKRLMEVVFRNPGTATSSEALFA